MSLLEKKLKLKMAKSYCYGRSYYKFMFASFIIIIILTSYSLIDLICSLSCCLSCRIMGVKRPFDEEDFQVSSVKQAKQLEFDNKQTSFSEAFSSDDVSQNSGSRGKIRKPFFFLMKLQLHKANINDSAF